MRRLLNAGLLAATLTGLLGSHVAFAQPLRVAIRWPTGVATNRLEHALTRALQRDGRFEIRAC